MTCKCIANTPFYLVLCKKILKSYCYFILKVLPLIQNIENTISQYNPREFNITSSISGVPTTNSCDISKATLNPKATVSTPFQVIVRQRLGKNMPSGTNKSTFPNRLSIAIRQLGSPPRYPRIVLNGR